MNTDVPNSLAPNGYRLVACNLSGVNAFFAHSDFADRFHQYAVEQLYRPARFYLARLAAEHPASMKFLSDKLQAPRPGGGT